MGCCCGLTYQQEVEAEIINYLKTVNKPESTKNILLKEIRDDLIKRASTVDRYHYPYRTEDVIKTVEYYKNYISLKLKGHIEFYEPKKKDQKKEKEKEKEKEKKEKEKNDKVEGIQKPEDNKEQPNLENNIKPVTDNNINGNQQELPNINNIIQTNSAEQPKENVTDNHEEEKKSEKVNNENNIHNDDDEIEPEERKDNDNEEKHDTNNINNKVDNQEEEKKEDITDMLQQLDDKIKVNEPNNDEEGKEKNNNGTNNIETNENKIEQNNNSLLEEHKDNNGIENGDKDKENGEIAIGNNNLAGEEHKENNEINQEGTLNENPNNIENGEEHKENNETNNKETQQDQENQDNLPTLNNQIIEGRKEEEEI